MSNWDIVKKSRILRVEHICNDYKINKKLDKHLCNSWCVESCCKNSKFKIHIGSKCAGNSCIDCWREFMEFLDIKPKRSNTEVYND